MIREKSEQVTLSPDNASVQERQVAIRVLTIGTKQVTQSLYRQLPEEDVIEWSTGKLQGEIWGWVNIHDTICKDTCRHIHAIWERDGQLKRSRVDLAACDTSKYRKLDTTLSDLGVVYISLDALAGNGQFLGQKVIHLSVNNYLFPVRVPQRLTYLKGITNTQYDSPCELLFPHEWMRIQYLCPEQYQSREDIDEAMHKIVKDMYTFHYVYATSVQTIKRAGQLFIAVSGVWK